MREPATTAALLAAIGLLLAVAGLASPISRRLGVPVLVLFLGLGILAGSEGIGGIPFDDYGLAYRLGTLALVLILFDGGLNTAPVVVRRAALPAGLLATVAVLATAFATAAVAHWLGLPWSLALLLGAVVSSTDAAAVFAVLRSGGVRLKQSPAATLELESGLNDPMAVFLTLVATEIALGSEIRPVEFAGLLLQQFALGGAIGVAMGYATRALLRSVRLPAAGLYPVLTVAGALLSFGVATLVDGSGFLAVYLTGIVLASGPLPYQAGLRRVHDALAWLSQITMFVILGLLVFPSRLLTWVPIGLAIAAALAFVTRPLAAWVVLTPLRVPWRERFFVSWVGLRGAVPIILAAYPVVRGVPGGDELFHLVFFVVLVNSFVPGATVSWLARRLGLVEGPHREPTAAVELVSLRDFPGEFLWFHVEPASAVSEAYVRDLVMPEGCLVTLVVRGREVVVPRGSTQLLPDDAVCVFATPESRAWLGLIFGGEAS
ncbi:MAG: potassium/proton antiporter [Parvularculaceae bacterium]|nr:potassium/proton antiporter [Parvularculaceae bacterium]